jgi:hypothetical protein
VSEIWFFPGLPLPNGAGWRIWYSQAGAADFAPQPVQISRASQPIAFASQWNLLPPLDNLPRRMGILTVTLEAPAPGQLFDVMIPESGQGQPFQWMALPNVPGENGVAFLFGSCFWRDNDKVGALPAAVRELCKRQPRPAFKLLCGDQLYQDWPVSFGTGTPLKICADRYDLYWGDPAYQDSLRACPNFFLCDDHEFWNDYPEFQIHLERTWSDKSRQAYTQATQDLYEYYQHSANGSATRWSTIDLGEVSLFISGEGGRTSFFSRAAMGCSRGLDAKSERAWGVRNRSAALSSRRRLERSFALQFSAGLLETLRFDFAQPPRQE